MVHFQLSADGPLLRTAALSALGDAATRERVYCAMGRLAERLVGMVVDGVVDGSIRALDPRIAAYAVASAVNAAAEIDRWLPGVSADTVDALYVRPAVQGLLCAGAPEFASHPPP